MKIIAITGRMGSGKSEVLGFLQRKGLCTLKADDLAKSFLHSNSPCFEELKVLFGVGLLNEKGGFNPKALAEEVFSKKPWKLKKLEALLHPLVRKELMSFAAQKESEGERLIFYEIPLLSHRNLFEDRFDCIILLTRPTASILKTLTEKGWKEKTIRERLKRQKKDQLKELKADFILKNNSSLEELFLQMEAILKNPVFFK